MQLDVSKCIRIFLKNADCDKCSSVFVMKGHLDG